MSRILEYFDRYTSEYKWNIIPVFSRSKIPVTKKWNDNYDKSWARFYVSGHPKINLGLLLGKIVDVEGDTPEANEVLNGVLAGHDHPTYQSSKSIHHLFLTPDAELTCLKFDGIEFRGNKHFSVVPPSVHAGGAEYKWLAEPSGGVPEMPAGLVEIYEKNKKQYKKLKIGFVAPACTCCGQKKPIHEKRFDLEVKAFQHHGQEWQCHGCRKVDVRELCRLIRRGKA